MEISVDRDSYCVTDALQTESFDLESSLSPIIQTKFSNFQVGETSKFELRLGLCKLFWILDFFVNFYYCSDFQFGTESMLSTLSSFNPHSNPSFRFVLKTLIELLSFKILWWFLNFNFNFYIISTLLFFSHAPHPKINSIETLNPQVHSKFVW